jgi:hypothetical protein
VTTLLLLEIKFALLLDGRLLELEAAELLDGRLLELGAAESLERTDELDRTTFGAELLLESQPPSSLEELNSA